MRSPRYLLAFAIAPAVPGFLFGMASLIFGLVDSLVGALAIAAIAAAIAYPVSIALGLPVIIILLEFRRMNLPTLLLAAALIGCVPGVFLSGFTISLGLLFFAGMGAVAGLAWWFISGVSSTQSFDQHAV